ncbi:hypothetical protein K9N50_06955 [bacterium]|nr:hypothetical protein [bacterium]
MSKSLEMVDLTMALFAKYRVNGDIQNPLSLLGKYSQQFYICDSNLFQSTFILLVRDDGII